MVQLQKQYKELTFTDDFMFGKVLVNNPEICRRLLEVLLEINIKQDAGKQNVPHIPFMNSAMHLCISNLLACPCICRAPNGS